MNKIDEGGLDRGDFAEPTPAPGLGEAADEAGADPLQPGMLSPRQREGEHLAQAFEEGRGSLLQVGSAAVAGVVNVEARASVRLASAYGHSGMAAEARHPAMGPLNAAPDGATVTALAEASGTSRATVTKALTAFADAGRAVRTA